MSRKPPETMPEWGHPIRMPADIALTHPNPPFALAGETADWTLPFVLAHAVPPEATVRLQIAGGRNNKGPFDIGKITACGPGGTNLPLEPVGKEAVYALSLPDTPLRKGDTITVTLADSKAPDISQPDKFFVLWMVPNGNEARMPRWADGSVWSPEAAEGILGVCTMHILGGELDHLRAYAESNAKPGETISILVRPEDRFDNLSHETPGDLSVFIDEQELPVSDIEAVAGSTCVRLCVALPTAGIYRPRVSEKDSGRETVLNPVVCGTRAKTWWGMIHGHTEMSDGTGTLERYFRQIRDETAIDFAAPGDHDHGYETPDEFWRLTCNAVRDWNAPGEFVTFLGYEWAKWRRNGDGDRNVYYLADDRPMYRSDDEEFPAPPDLFAGLSGNREKAIVIPHHTGHDGNFCDWKDHDPVFERLVEIHQVRGSYECSEEDGNPCPEKGATTYEAGYVRNALAMGWRVGFTGGGDDHVGHWGSERRSGYGYKQGLMCVEADDLTRESIFQAMYNRCVTATTGPRILLTYRLNERPMGSELSLTETPDLQAGRKLTIEFHGSAPIAHLDIIRNNTVVHSESPSPPGMDFSLDWEDNESMDGIWLPPAKFCAHGFMFYYVRVVQEDGEAAWASPVWIDP